MRIARVLTRLNFGGPARQVLASDPLLVARGHELRIFAGHPEPGEGDLFETLAAEGLDVVRVPRLSRGISPGRDLLALWRLKRELAALAPDLLHTHASKAGTLGRRAVEGLPGAERIGRVHTFHGHVLGGLFPAPVTRRLVALERRLARRTDRIVAVSHATADDLVRLGIAAEERLVVIPPGIRLGPFLELPLAPPEERGGGPLRRRLGVAPDGLLVGVGGRLAEVKRPEWALDVWQLLEGRFPGLHLVFVGDGALRGLLERRFRAAGEAGARRLHLLGNEPDMPAVLRALDVVLCTSRSEGMPVALIEAAAAGIPAVATDVGGVGELVAHERTGWLGRSVEELAFALAHLLESPAERRAAGQRARLRVSARHSAVLLAARLEQLYTLVLEERRAGRP